MKTPIHIEQAVLCSASKAAAAHIQRERAFGARNYDPLPVVLGQGAGAWLIDVDGKRYLDLMSAYSAVSFGHAHPKIVAALVTQAQNLAVTSRAFYNDQLPALLERLARLTGLDRALPSNGGAEAVETALKAARKWGYSIKGIPADRAEIIVCASNFHGRSIAIVGFSSEPQYREGFGPFPLGFVTIPFGDADALAAAITPNTAAFLVEPIQGEGGIIVPPEGYLAACARICRERKVLLICDEIQTGLGRTGHLLACQHDDVRPDGVILGKALGGGLLPVSAFVATHDVMRVFTPGDHGSTFGGNPLAAAVAMAALDVLEEEDLCARSQETGAWLMRELRALSSPLIREIRGRGLYIGIEIDPRRLPARQVVDRLLARGILSKDTHGTVVRIAPPLNVAQEDLRWAVGELREVLGELDEGATRSA
jgi:ornithine--oxo-acid transaminase